MSDPTVPAGLLPVLRAVIAVYDHTGRTGGSQPVRAFHVRFFGLAECVTDRSLDTIDRHLRRLAQLGALAREEREAAYLPTERGRALS